MVRNFAVLALLAGCGATEASTKNTAPEGVTATPSDEIVTVVHVSWRTDETTTGYVEYGATEALGQRTPVSESGRDHEVALLGLQADTTYFYRVVVENEEEESDIREVTTGSLPGVLPHLDISGEPHDLFTLVPIIGRTDAITIIDGEGKLVWYHQEERKLDFYRARLTRDGRFLVYNAATVSGDPAEDSELVLIALDGSRRESLPVPLLAHDFVELPDGSFAAIGVEYRPFAGNDRIPAMDLRGNRIVEVGSDGELRTVWTTWDCFDPEETPGEDIEIGWSMANALDYDPESNAYLLGMRNFSSIAKIGRDTGECEWVLGEFGSTFEFASGSERFLHQHQFQLDGNRLLVLDNDGSIDIESRVLEYELDFEAEVATEVWQYLSDPPVYTFVLGEPTRFDDGTLFVNWGGAGQLERVDGDGSASWTVNLPAGFVFGFHTLTPSLYPGGG